MFLRECLFVFCVDNLLPSLLFRMSSDGGDVTPHQTELIVSYSAATGNDDLDVCRTNLFVSAQKSHFTAFFKSNAKLIEISSNTLYPAAKLELTICGFMIFLRKWSKTRTITVARENV